MVTSILVSSCFRTPFASQPIHVSQTLLEHALQRFYPNFPLLFKKVSWKISPLLRSQILGIFGNTFTAGRMYSCHTWKKLQQPVQTLLSHKRRIFSAILLLFWNLHKILFILNKKVSFIAYIFWKLLIPTNVVTSMPVSSCFGTPFDSKRIHGPKHCWNMQ